MELTKADYNQLKRDVEKRKQDFGTTLYHYTSLNTFLRMTKNREIWLSSTGSMNDSKELSYYVELFEKELSQYKRADFFKKVYDKIESNYKYAFCLSLDKDDAAQWERYGDSAMGVCIGFNVEEWCKCLYGYPDIMFNSVFYGDSVKEDAYCHIVKEYFETGKIKIYSSEDELIRQIIYAGNLHKHKSFKNEHEIRITTMDNDEQDGMKYELKEIGNVVKKVLVLKLDIMGNLMKTGFEKMIDEIIIGPKSQQNIDVLQQYVISQGMCDLVNKISISECSLR